MEAQPGVILLVDDDPDDVYLTRHAFAGSDIATEIVVARDGVEALQLLLPQDEAIPLRPVIVLLDIHLPRMGGLQLLARLRADPTTRTLPVIMLTTSTLDRDMAESYSRGGNGDLPKPVTPAAFLVAAHALGVWPLINRHPTPETG